MQVHECTTSWGVLGALTRSGLLPSKAYTVVVDSRVRGPFLPSYAASAMHWTEAFTNRLTGVVKMVGSVISCEGAPRGGHAAMEWRLNPHVVPHAWATDAEGWRLLSSDPTIMQCFDSRWDTKYYSDVGAGLAMLHAGHNIDSLLTRYQGVDWWSEASWDCNGRCVARWLIGFVGRGNKESCGRVWARPGWGTAGLQLMFDSFDSLITMEAAVDPFTISNTRI